MHWCVKLVLYIQVIGVNIFELQDQMWAFDMIKGDSELNGLNLIQAPLVDVEIQGVRALRFLGDIVWK
jgi:hypothetical protein